MYTNSTQRNTEILLVISKDIYLEVNAETTKYMFTSRLKNEGQNIKIVNKSLNYFGRTLINQNSMIEEITSPLNSGIS
jgi:hypothetical protein